MSEVDPSAKYDNLRLGTNATYPLSISGARWAGLPRSERDCMVEIASDLRVPGHHDMAGSYGNAYALVWCSSSSVKAVAQAVQRQHSDDDDDEVEHSCSCEHTDWLILGTLLLDIFVETWQRFKFHSRCRHRTGRLFGAPGRTRLSR